MATAAHRAAVQTALLSVRGLRRRRLGHVSPTDYPQNGLDKWGRKRLDNNNNNIGNHPSTNYYNYNGAIHPSVTNKSLSPPPPLLNNGGGKRPVVPRATLVLGGEKSIISKSRRNGLNSGGGGGGGGLENGLSTTTSTKEAIGEGNIDNGVQQVEERRQRSHPPLTSPAKTSSYDDDITTVNVAPILPNNNANDTSQHAVGAERSNNIHTSVSSNRKSSSNSCSTTTTTTQRRQKYSSDLIVILDMDECLIHSQFLSDRCVDKYRQVEDRPTNNKSYPTSTTSQQRQPQPQQRQYGGVRGNGPDEDEADSLLFTNAGCDSFRIHLPDGDLVNVNKRPNLDIFLNEITRKFETYIFTAAVEVYAAPVLNQLDPTGDMFRGRFYREHCRYDPDLGVYAKDVCDVLRMRQRMIRYNDDDDDDVGEGYGMDGYGYDEAAYHDEQRNNHGMNLFSSLYANNNNSSNSTSCDVRRVVLVDNNPLSFLPNPSNGILVSSFYDDPKDDTLEAVMELLHELDESDDVRPILDDRFGLRDALDDVTKGAAAIRW